MSSCDVDQFHCSNGKCIPDWWRCNSMDECGDNSDEELCVDSPFSFQPCSLNQFPCLSRYTRIYTCLPHSLRCDGSIDCQVTNLFSPQTSEASGVPQGRGVADPGTGLCLFLCYTQWWPCCIKYLVFYSRTWVMRSTVMFPPVENG